MHNSALWVKLIMVGSNYAQICGRNGPVYTITIKLKCSSPF